MTDPTHRADLVLEGGGVKGLALVGAISVLEENGYAFPRVAGTSAGAIVGSLVAAGMDATQLRQVMLETDFRDFKDEGWVQRFTGPVGKAGGLIFKNGIYRGDFFLNLLQDLLKGVGVETFGDLRLPEDEAASISRGTPHRLVVMGSDINSEELVRLPWDLQSKYGIDPESFEVASAVRASMAIPFFFRPYILKRGDGKGGRGKHTLVDGGMLSNFPIDVFDTPAGREPRWPTIGLKLSAKVENREAAGDKDVSGPIKQTIAMLGTMTGFYDELHVGTKAVQDRTIFIDNLGVSSVDFELTRETQEKLYQSGRDAATKFLSTWDFEAYKREHRSV